VHTAETLRSEHFAITIDGAPAGIADLLPGLTEHDRLGLVLTTDHAGAGASLVILAAVTAFYDRLRAQGDDFLAYPDHFAFHVGARRGTHGALDLWRPHKEVEVAADPEELLRAINDRAITRLLVEDRPPADAAFERDTLASARRRIRTVLAYAPAGRVASPDVTIAGSADTEVYVQTMFERDGAPSAVRAARGSLVEDGRPVETYRRLALDVGLACLVGSRG
jgi:hypothetical protein